MLSPGAAVDYSRTSPRRMRRIGFLVLNDFSMVSLASAIEVLRMINQAIGRHEYSWSIITPTGCTAFSIDGATQVGSITYAAAGPLDLVLVCGGHNVDKFATDDVIALLRLLHHEGIALGGLGSGPHALLRAGLMSGYKCAIEWHDMQTLKRTYSNVHFQETNVVLDRDRFTSQGGTAPISLMRAIASMDLGYKFVQSVFDAAAIRADSLSELPGREFRTSIPNRCPAALAQTITLMETELEQPLSICNLAKQAGISVRQIERMFRNTFGTTPTKYYVTLRLRRAQELILHSSMSIADISVSCGFDSPSHFSNSYRTLFGRTPSSERSIQTHRQ